ncbi:glycosyl transferase family 1 [Luteimicrobium subarcticum]|uniref:Glycosyl transferase family 1 n=1 Tax=Luteimicrobium subarcticum TaxID=620910 RepID=A0A2M8WTG7_9MICO|nr:glycosyl transferase family 1 [Luteimicrobium subarcticum]
MVARPQDLDAHRLPLEILTTVGPAARLGDVELRTTTTASGSAFGREVRPLGLATGGVRRTVQRAASAVRGDRSRVLAAFADPAEFPPGERPASRPERTHYLALVADAEWPEDVAPANRAPLEVEGVATAGQRLRELASSRAGGRWKTLRGWIRRSPARLDEVLDGDEWPLLLDALGRDGVSFDLGDWRADAAWLATHERRDAALGLCEVARRTGAVGVGSIEHRVVEELVRVARAGAADTGTEALAHELSAAADTALDDGDAAHAVRLFALLLHLLFQRDLHVVSESSPLVERPDAWTAPLRTSAVRRRIIAADLRARPDAADATGGAQGLVFLAGSYPRFGVPVVRALTAAGLDPHVVDPGDEDAALRGISVDEGLLRVLAGVDPVPDSWPWLDAVRGAAAVFVEWADRAAPFAVAAASTDARVVLRVHSVDLLSAWLHLVDVDRVDELVVVSDAMVDVVVGVLGADVRPKVRVVPNVVAADQMARPKLPGAERTLAMVGWAQTVKDPLWAVEVLALLRAEDPAWRLLLVGADFPRTRVESDARYALAVRRRLLRPDVRDAVELTGWTSDVAGVLARAGYVLSTSRRESASLAVVEGMASGAVPVVRDWPVYARVDAARRALDARWVVSTPAEAAARVLAASQRLEEESRAAREWVASQAYAEDPADRYARLVRGEAE